MISLLFLEEKAPKTPGRDKDVIKRVKRQARLSVLERVITSYLKSVVCSFCSRVALQHPSAKPGAKAHSFGELKLPSSQTLLARNGATSNLSAVCRVLRVALRTAILRKDNCRTTFERASHNGLQTAEISVVILTLPVFL